jgi:hypothetical protein
MLLIALREAAPCYSSLSGRRLHATHRSKGGGSMLLIAWIAALSAPPGSPIIVIIIYYSIIGCPVNGLNGCPANPPTPAGGVASAPV